MSALRTVAVENPYNTRRHCFVSIKCAQWLTYIPKVKFPHPILEIFCWLYIAHDMLPEPQCLLIAQVLL